MTLLKGSSEHIVTIADDQPLKAIYRIIGFFGIYSDSILKYSGNRDWYC